MCLWWFKKKKIILAQYFSFFFCFCWIFVIFRGVIILSYVQGKLIATDWTREQEIEHFKRIFILSIPKWIFIYTYISAAIVVVVNDNDVNSLVRILKQQARERESNSLYCPFIIQYLIVNLPQTTHNLCTLYQNLGIIYALTLFFYALKNSNTKLVFFFSPSFFYLYLYL